MSRQPIVSDALPALAAPDANFYFLLKQIHDANVHKQTELDRLHASLECTRQSALRTQSQLELANVTQDKRVQLAESRTALLNERVAEQSASMAAMDAELAELRQRAAATDELRAQVQQLDAHLQGKADECARIKEQLREAHGKNRHFENMLSMVQSLSQADRASLRTTAGGSRVSFKGLAAARGSSQSIRSEGSCATTTLGADGQSIISQEASVQSFRMGGGGASAALHLRPSDSRSTTATLRTQHSQQQPLQRRPQQPAAKRGVDQAVDTTTNSSDADGAPSAGRLRTSDQAVLMPGTDLQRSLRSRAELIRQRYLQN